MLTVTLSQEQWNLVLNYIATGPYREVARLLEAIVGQLKAQQEPPAAEGGPS